jgi:hypothetical protein
MRASARATATVPRHLFERAAQEPFAAPAAPEAEQRALVALEELATTLEDALARVNDLRERERIAAAA